MKTKTGKQRPKWGDSKAINAKNPPRSSWIVRCHRGGCLCPTAYPWRGRVGARWQVFSDTQNVCWLASTCSYRRYVGYEFWNRGTWFICAHAHRSVHLRMRKVRGPGRRGRRVGWLGWRLYVICPAFPWVDKRTVVAIWTSSILRARADFPLSTHHDTTANDSPHDGEYISCPVFVGIGVGAWFRGRL